MTGQGGGVLLAVSKRLNCEEQPDLTTDCNITWVKISIKGIRSIFVSSFNKPHENDEKNLTELWKGTSRQRSGKGAIRKKIPTPKTEVGKNQTNSQVLIP